MSSARVAPAGADAFVTTVLAAVVVAAVVVAATDPTDATGAPARWPTVLGDESAVEQPPSASTDSANAMAPTRLRVLPFLEWPRFRDP
jgi:hypothetical protein